jgi:hypothetical protein
VLRRVAEEAEIRQVEELAVARRRGGRESWRRLETACTRTGGLGLQQPSMHQSRGSSPKKRRPASSSRRPKAASSALGLRWWRRLKIEAAVDREGKIAAVRCRAALDEGVEAVFEGTAPGYRLPQVGKTAGETAGTGGEEVAEKTATSTAENLERRGGGRRGSEPAGGGVERLLEEARREFSSLPVYGGLRAATST